MNQVIQSHKTVTELYKIQLQKEKEQGQAQTAYFLAQDQGDKATIAKAESKLHLATDELLKSNKDTKAAEKINRQKYEKRDQVQQAYYLALKQGDKTTIAKAEEELHLAEEELVKISAEQEASN